MLKYVNITDLDDDESMTFSAEDQCWDTETLKQLKEEYNIVFKTSGRGVLPIMIINRGTDNPLFVIGGEDDGTISFKRKYGNFQNCFSYYWAKSFISDIEEALRICKE